MPRYVTPIRQFVEETRSAFISEIDATTAVRLGDMAIAEDTGKTYVCTALSPVTWTELGAAGAPGAVSWGDIGGTLSAQTDLVGALNGKQAAVTGSSLVADTEIAKIHASGSDNQDLSGREPANANIQAHVTAAHAPASAQANADITKAEIEAKLTGELSSHSHGDVGTHAALKTGVHGLLNSVRVQPQVTPVAESTGAVTVHIADMLLGIVTGNPSAARAYTLDTGANCDAGMTIGTDEAFDWVLINLNTTAANIITLTASTGHTIVGSVKVPSNSATTGGLWGTSSALWRTRKTGANTFVTYRIG